MKKLLSTAVLLTAALVPTAGAQTLTPVWNGPDRLSDPEGLVRDRAIVVDSQDRAHVVWIDDAARQGRYTLYYVQGADGAWTEPRALVALTDVFAGSMTRLDLDIDSADRLHLIWSANWAPIHYLRVDADQALTPSAWNEIGTIDSGGWRQEMLADVSGGLTVVYCPAPSTDPSARRGVYASRSTDGGRTWSEGVRIDPAMPGDWYVQDLDAEYNGFSALHVSWTYVAPDGYQVREVRYARSLDGGRTWSVPVLLDSAPDGDRDFIRLATPEISTRGDVVNIIWSGGPPTGVGRRQAVSQDSGATWGETRDILGQLHGRAGSDTAEYDSAGRLHWFGQVRWPQGVYHAVYADDRWSEPQMIYRIAQDFMDPIADRVHAHEFEMAFMSGDRPVMLFESCGAGCSDNSEWLGPVEFVMTLEGPIDGGAEFVSLSAASYREGGPLAPESIAAGFGAELAADTTSATSTELPTELDGLTVEVVDRRNNYLPAELFFTSPGQINYLTPGGAVSGEARVRVFRNGRYLAGGMIDVQRTAPALFTADASGTGVAAAFSLHAASDGTQRQELIFDPETGAGAAIKIEPNGETYLLLFGTGVRLGSTVSVTVGGRPVAVLGALPQVQFAGLDQINIGPLPGELVGAGEVEIVLTVDGVEANRVLAVIE